MILILYVHLMLAHCRPYCPFPMGSIGEWVWINDHESIKSMSLDDLWQPNSDDAPFDDATWEIKRSLRIIHTETI